MDYVYLMRSGDRFKIGRARDVGRRWRTFRTADPAITVEHIIPCRQASVLEAALHRRFDHKHIDLEWFRLTPEDIIYIKSLGGSSGLRLIRHGVAGGSAGWASGSDWPCCSSSSAWPLSISSPVCLKGCTCPG